MFTRLGVITLVFGLTASLGQAQDERDDRQGQAQANQQPTQVFPLPIPVDIVEDEATAEARERRAEEARQREIADLAAQKGMNAATQSIDAATQDMRDYALYSTLLVAVGTALLFYTLWLTRQANAAAQAAVDVTREIGEAQVKAYLSIKRMKGVLHTAGDNPFVEIWATVKNSGQSPALDVRVGVDGKIFARHNHQDGFGDIAGGATSERRLLRSLEPPLVANGRGKVAFLFDVNIYFKDVFSKSPEIKKVSERLHGHFDFESAAKADFTPVDVSIAEVILEKD
ncbi:hypothetical protein [Roseovarius sp. E0-M6]|uniref:hypothetical protein n=1 Tax=Roseovarius sp. E0-M6 TaxID=3127118 RepID=UPI0030100030